MKGRHVLPVIQEVLQNAGAACVGTEQYDILTLRYCWNGRC